MHIDVGQIVNIIGLILGAIKALELILPQIEKLLSFILTVLTGGSSQNKDK